MEVKQYDGQYSDKVCISLGIRQRCVIPVLDFMDVHDYVDANNDGLGMKNISDGSLTYADDIIRMSNTKNNEG